MVLGEWGTFFGPKRPVVAKHVVDVDRNALLRQREHQRKIVDSPKISQRAGSHRPGGGDRTRKREASPPPPPRVTAGRPETQDTQKVKKLKEARDFSFLFSEGGMPPQKAKEPSRLSDSKSTAAKGPSGRPAGLGPSSSSFLRKPGDSSRPASHHKMQGRVSNSVNQHSAGRASSGGHAYNGARSNATVRDKGQVQSRDRPSAGAAVDRAGGGGHMRGHNHAAPPKHSASARPSSSAAAPPHHVGRGVGTGAGRGGGGLGERRVGATGVEDRKGVGGGRVDNHGGGGGGGGGGGVAKRKPLAGRQGGGGGGGRGQLREKQLIGGRRVREEDEESNDSFVVSGDEDEGYGGYLDTSVLNMFRRNHSENHRSRWEDEGSDDDRGMEVGWSQMRAEESRSARLARQEDEREAKLLALEEEKARQRRKKKKT